MLQATYWFLNLGYLRVRPANMLYKDEFWSFSLHTPIQQSNPWGSIPSSKSEEFPSELGKFDQHGSISYVQLKAVAPSARAKPTTAPLPESVRYFHKQDGWKTVAIDQVGFHVLKAGKKLPNIAGRAGAAAPSAAKKQKPQEVLVLNDDDDDDDDGEVVIEDELEDAPTTANPHLLKKLKKRPAPDVGQEAGSKQPAAEATPTGEAAQANGAEEPNQAVLPSAAQSASTALPDPGARGFD